MNDKIINGLVYRDGKKIIFISFFDEKKKEIFENQYFHLGENNQPIPEECLVLVHYQEQHNRIETTPLSLVNLTLNSHDALAKKLSTDGLIYSAYGAAKKYLEVKKSLKI
jgi:hypothetical protein